MQTTTPRAWCQAQTIVVRRIMPDGILGVGGAAVIFSGLYSGSPLQGDLALFKRCNG